MNYILKDLIRIIIKTGIEFIAEERKEQIEKHQIPIKEDVLCNAKGQLAKGAATLIHWKLLLREPAPEDWNDEKFEKMKLKDYKDRLIIAGALIAAELDRIIEIE